MQCYNKPNTYPLVVALRKPLTFSVVCTENRGQRSTTTQQTKTMKPPLDVIKLRVGCSGSTNLLNLPPYYQFEDHATVKDPFNNLIELRTKSKFRIWDHLEEALPKFTKIELLNLAALKQVPMTDLIWKLRDMRKVEIKDESWPMWVYIMLNGGICILGGAQMFLYLRYRKNNSCFWNPWLLHSICSLWLQRLDGQRRATSPSDVGVRHQRDRGGEYTSGQRSVCPTKRRGYVGLFPEAPLPKSTKGD